MFMHDVLGKLEIHQVGPSLRRISSQRADGVLEFTMRCDLAVGNVEMHGAIAQRQPQLRCAPWHQASAHQFCSGDQGDQGLEQARSSPCFHIMKHGSGQLKVSVFRFGIKVF